MVNLAPTLWQRFSDSNNVLLAGGKIYSYVAGTNTPSATYTDSTGVTPNTNPVILDAAGYCNLWLGNGAYKFVLTDANDNQLKTIDEVQAPGSTSSGGAPVTQTLVDNQSAYANITNLIIDHTANQCVSVEYTFIRTDGTNYRRERGVLVLLYDTQNGWSLNRITQGADALNAGVSSLQIISTGQVQYKSDSMGGTYKGQITWRIANAFAAEGI